MRRQDSTSGAFTRDLEEVECGSNSVSRYRPTSTSLFICLNLIYRCISFAIKRYPMHIYITKMLRLSQSAPVRPGPGGALPVSAVVSMCRLQGSFCDPVSRHLGSVLNTFSLELGRTRDISSLDNSITSRISSTVPRRLRLINYKCSRQLYNARFRADSGAN